VGAVSAFFLYPLEDRKVRNKAIIHVGEEVANGTSGSKKPLGMVEYAKRLYEKEGIQVYLNGIETSAFQSSIEKAFYFFAYTALKNFHGTVKQLYSSSDPSSPMSAPMNLFLGCLAEWAHLPITMPIDCLSTAIQTSQKQNAFALMLSILKEGNMYKGIQAYYVLCFKPALQYTVFEQVKTVVLRSRSNKTLSAPESFLLGMVARTVATVAVFPFVRAKVVMQSRKTKSSEDGSEDQKNPTVLNWLNVVYQTDGIGGLYQGLGPELTRGVFYAAVKRMNIS
jgi:hypothetical protein